MVASRQGGNDSNLLSPCNIAPEMISRETMFPNFPSVIFKEEVLVVIVVTTQLFIMPGFRLLGAQGANNVG